MLYLRYVYFMSILHQFYVYSVSILCVYYFYSTCILCLLCVYAFLFLEASTLFLDTVSFTFDTPFCHGQTPNLSVKSREQLPTCNRDMLSDIANCPSSFGCPSILLVPPE